MLVRLYQFLGIMLLTGYATSSFFGWEYSSPILVRTAPPINAMVGATSRGWNGRSAYVNTGSSSGTRSGWGGVSFGGK